MAGPGGFDATRRRREPELMDEPGLDRSLHEDALDALGRIGRVSLTTGRAWREVVHLASDGRRPVRVLDVACGGGDVLIELARRARSHRVDVELIGCDRSHLAIERARLRSAQSRVASRGGRAETRASLRFEERDVLRGRLPGSQDLVLCSLFLHHLSRSESVAFLRSLAAACEGVLLLQDLRRRRLGYWLAWLGLHALTRSTVARRDGLVSVQAAFTLDEARALVEEAGLGDAEVSPCWPQRFSIRWMRSREDR